MLLLQPTDFLVLELASARVPLSGPLLRKRGPIKVIGSEQVVIVDRAKLQEPGWA